jgi:hypothetical protein
MFEKIYMLPVHNHSPYVFDVIVNDVRKLI